MTIDRLLDIVRLRWRSLVHPQAVDRELDEELRFHLDQQIDVNLKQGMTPAEAKTHALRSIGGATETRPTFSAGGRASGKGGARPSSCGAPGVAGADAIGAGASSGWDVAASILPVPANKMDFNNLPLGSRLEFNSGRLMAPRIQKWYADASDPARARADADVVSRLVGALEELARGGV